MLTQETQFDQTRNLVVAKPGADHLTGQSMAELTDALGERMRYDNATLFVIDMSGVTFMDSAGIGALVTFLQDLEHVRGRIGVAGCQPNVEFLFKVTRLDAAITLFDDVEEATDEWL